MSIHKSLVVKSALARARNVYTRAERLQAMQKDGRWTEGDSIYNLPKLKTRAKVRKIKKEKKAEDAAAGDAAAPPAGAAAAKPAGKK